MFLYTSIGAAVAVIEGKSRQSFAVQVSGVLCIAINLILCFLFYENLLRPLN